MEKGDSGVAFKHTERLVSRELELEPLIASGNFITVKRGDQLVGCLFFEPVSEDGAIRIHFGPFAVDPSVKGQGIGKVLLADLDRRAEEIGAKSLDIEVVNVRDDLFPMYRKMGFIERGEAPFVAPERTTRAVHFILMRRELL